MFKLLVLWIKLQWQDFFTGEEDRALVLIRNGNTFSLETGYRKKRLEQGDEYHYGKRILIVEKGHPVESFLGRRLLGLRAGELVASPFQGCGKQQDETFISQFVQGSVMTKLVTSFAGGGIPIKLIVIAGAVLVIGFMAYKYFVGGGEELPVPLPSPTPDGWVK